VFGAGEVYENSVTGKRAVAPVETDIRLTAFEEVSSPDNQRNGL